MKLYLGRRDTSTPLAEATPGDTVCGWRMADVTYPDGVKRFAPMGIVFIRHDDPSNLFEFAGVAS